MQKHIEGPNVRAAIPRRSVQNRNVVNWWGVGACSLLVLGASACAPSLENNPPRAANTEMPAQFGRDDAATAEGASIGEISWADYFKDPQLCSLVETALKNNQELNSQLQELIIANAEVMATRGEYLPRLDGSVGVGVDKVGSRTSRGRSDEADGVPDPMADFRFGLQASWEIDIWKKLRNRNKAAALRYLASIEGRKFVITQLVSELAHAYYDLVSLDRQVDVLDQNIEIQQNALEVVRLEKQAARVTQLAVQRFEAEVLKNRSRRFRLQQSIIEAENRINFLVGRYPQPVQRNVATFDSAIPEAFATGVPSRLLDNRPDVKQAELQLSAAELDVKAAKAEFYPSLSIEAGVGYESFNLKYLVQTPESLFGNIAGNLTAPLLNRKAIKARYYASNARQIQAVFDYERALLNGFTEVANQLARIDNLRQGYELEWQQVDMLTKAIEVSNVLFQSARADYMEVLLTRRDALDAQMELIDTKREQLHATVDIYRALGGGWRSAADTQAGSGGEAPTTASKTAQAKPAGETANAADAAIAAATQAANTNPPAASVSAPASSAPASMPNEATPAPPTPRAVPSSPALSPAPGAPAPSPAPTP